MEFNRGEMVPAYERPSRADNVLASLEAAKLGPLVTSREFQPLAAPIRNLRNDRALR